MNEESRQIVNVAIGLIATLSALVLGLLVASAKSSFDARNDEIKQSATKLVLLDRTLRQYGPETNGIRALLQELTQRRIDHTWNNARRGRPVQDVREDAIEQRDHPRRGSFSSRRPRTRSAGCMPAR